MQSPKLPRYRFGPFELDPGQGTLSRQGTNIRLQDLPFRLLLMLVERPGEVVSREEVRERLWPENTFVEFDNSLGVAIRKVRDSLDDDADTPRFVETLPRKGYRFMAPVTVVESEAPDPVFSAEGEPAEKAKGGDVAAAVLAPKATTNDLSAGSRFWIIAGLVLVVVGGAISWFRSAPRRGGTKAEAANLVAPIRTRRSVAVLGFRNLPGRPEDNWLSPAFSEMLNTELAAGGTLRMVSGEDVARAKRELPLSDEDSLAQGTLERLKKNPGADVVVLGSYTPVPGDGGKRIRLDVRVQDTARGETIAEQSFTGSEDALFELATQAGTALRQSLGVASISVDDTNGLRASLPANQLAAREYADGRSKLWAFDFQGARDTLLKAVAADPNYPLAHSALSEAWWHLGYHEKARAEAQQALGLSGHLPQEERLLVEGQYRRTLGDWPKTVEAYQTLYRLFPDSLDYGLLLASAQGYVKQADALRTLASLRNLPSPSGDDPRIDMQEATAWIGTDSVKAREAANRAIAKATAQGSHVIVERTYGVLCHMAPSFGDSAEALRDCENALQSSVAANDLNGAAMMRLDIADIQYTMGDLRASEDGFRKAILQFRQVGNDDGAATAANDLGGVLFTRGDLSAAKKLIESSIGEYQAAADKDGVALALNDLAEIARQSGNLDVAETTLQQAKATAQEIDDKSAIAYVLSGMGDVLADRGDFTAARQSYEEALKLRNQTEEKQLVAETQLSLARLAILEGHPGEVVDVIKNAGKQFHAENEADDELAASTVSIEALLAQGNVPGAAQEGEAHAALAAKSQNPFTLLQYELAAARAKLASDHPNEARLPLAHVLKEARAHGFLGIELEARLAAAEQATKAGHSSAAKADLISLEQAAHAKGFGRIAAKAAAERKSL